MSDDRDEVIRPPYSVSAEVERLTLVLREVPMLQQITHEKLSEVIGENAVGPRGRAIVRKARLRLEAEERVVFRAVNGIGLERCDDDGKLDVAKNGVKSVRRKVQRTETVLNAVVIDQLEEANKTQYILNKTILAMLRQGSDARFGKALQKRLADSTTNLSSVNLLRLFGKEKKQE